MRGAIRPGLFVLVASSLLLGGCMQPVRQDASIHIVRQGETLFSIASRYDKRPTDVARWNRLGNGSLIYPGQVLKLRPGPTTNARRTESRPLPGLPSEPSPGWAWPTAGRINVAFGGNPGPGTGVLINGKSGQAVLAAAPGRVVYAGKGLIGYGQLVIIKHNESYLSAYGYNRKVLVKEGDMIKRGQRIATMGEGPERKARLHFEIRRNGTPLDPATLLPRR